MPRRSGFAIEQPEREAKEADQVAKLKREQDRTVRRMKGLLLLSNSNYEDGDNCASSFDDQDPPPSVDGYSCPRNRKGKGWARK
ncbi:hypothetical protein D1007_44996 [Hordeum vulgare]|nr:hypothetical protein D1007_44996 [Hordeum vulgare]